MGEAFEGFYYLLDWSFLLFFAEFQGSAVPQVLEWFLLEPTES